MSTEISQHIIVTLIALAASATLVRRMFGPVGPHATRTGCDGCPSARRACGTTTQTRSVAVRFFVRRTTG